MLHSTFVLGLFGQFTDLWSAIYVVFSLLTGAIGYLIADRFFGKKYNALQQNFESSQVDAALLREQNDILQKQAALAVPHTEVEDLRYRLSRAEEDRSQIHGDFLANTATIAGLNARLSALTAEHEKLKEEATSNTAISSTEAMSLHDSLIKAKERIAELTAEKEAVGGHSLSLDSPSMDILETPYSDVPTIEVPHLAAPHVEEPVVELPHAGVPHIEAPVVEVPHIETPVVEIPHFEVPVIEHPTAEWSIDAPHIEAPVVETPHTEVPVVEVPEVVAPTVDLPHVDVPSFEPLHVVAPVGFQSASIIDTIIDTPVEKIEVPSKILKTPYGDFPISSVFIVDRKEAGATFAVPIDTVAKPVVVAAAVVEEVVPVAEPVVVAAPVVEEVVPVAEPVVVAAVAEVDEAPVAEMAKAPHPVYGMPDDLKVVEGIGPKIELLLKSNGIHTWKDLSDASLERIKEILHSGGNRYSLNDPSTWSKQARLLERGEWVKFKQYTDYLINGRDPAA
jgi:predicted flap endonuclease-1-like 5' DNA nuclease